MPEWSQEIRRRLEGLKVDPQREASVVEEISQHLDDRYAELLSCGESPEAARRQALDDLATDAGGLVSALSEALPRPGTPVTSPAETRGGFLSGLGKDFRYGARRLLLEPGFSLVAILSLALGVGANTAIFQLLDAVRRCCYELPVVGVDVVEVAPPYDHADITAYLGNRVVLEALSAIARRRRDAAAGSPPWNPRKPLLM